MFLTYNPAIESTHTATFNPHNTATLGYFAINTKLCKHIAYCCNDSQCVEQSTTRAAVIRLDRLKLLLFEGLRERTE